MTRDRDQVSHHSFATLLREVDAVLFDFDGVIADTERYQAESYAHLLVGHGINFSVDDFKPYVGKSETQIYQMFKRRYGVALDTPENRKKRMDYAIEAMITGGLQPYPFVGVVLAYLERLGHSSFIVSSNNAPTIRKLLSNWSLDGRFEGVYTTFDFGSTITKDRLIAMAPQLVGHGPGNLVIFEDSKASIEAARQIGMHTVGVINSMNTGTNIDADFIIDAASYLGEDLG
jgi:beta-phosphoglucomutase